MPNVLRTYLRLPLHGLRGEMRRLALYRSHRIRHGDLAMRNAARSDHVHQGVEDGSPQTPREHSAMAGAAERAVQESAAFRSQDFDCLGFDLDHTLVRYKAQNLMELIHWALASYFVEHCGWDASLTRVKFDPHFCHKSIALDFHTGDFLKLDDEGHVLRAYHGTSPLDAQTLRRRYPGKWRHFDDLRRHVKGDDFMYFLTYFDIPASHFVAHLIDRTDAAGGPSDYRALLPDLRASFAANFGPDAFLHDTGWYFPAVKADPDRYLYRRPEVKEWLKRVRAQGVKLLLLTNSHFDYTQFLMTYAFGSDWKALFDLSIVYAQKPAFFEEKRPFAVIDEETCREARWLGDDETPSLAPPGAAADAPVYACGNIAGVRSLLGDRVVYFGDHLVGDIRAARAVGWSTVAVVEEAQEVAQHAVAVRRLQGAAADAAGSDKGAHEQAAPPSAAWGSFYLAGHGDTPREADAEEPPSRLTLGAIMALEHSDYVVQDVADLLGSA